MNKTRGINFIKLVGVTAIGSLLMAGIAFAATTISTNISTGGTLSVTGASTLSSTLGVTGLSTLTGGYVSQASSTVVGAFTTTGANSFGSTLGVTGLSTLTGGYVSQASSTVVGAFTQSSGLATFSQASTTGLHTLTGGFLSTASSTVVGTTTISGPGNSAGLVLNTTAISQLLFGTCTVNSGAIAASTTVSTTCTATGVNTGSKVFVTPQSLPNQVVFTGASSTAANTIQVSLYNIGSPSGSVTPAAMTWSWFALQ